MKKLTLILIIAVISMRGYAQEDKQIAKKDAIEFINKVFANFRKKDYFFGSYTTQFFLIRQKPVNDSTIFSINKCILTVKEYQTLTIPLKVDKNREITHVVYISDLDLSSLKIDTGNSWEHHVDVLVENTENINPVHCRTNLTSYNAKTHAEISFDALKTNDPVDYTGDKSGFWIAGRLNEKDESYLSGHYDLRLRKALTFLIERCGGGEQKKAPIDTGGKF